MIFGLIYLHSINNNILRYTLYTRENYQNTHEFKEGLK